MARRIKRKFKKLNIVCIVTLLVSIIFNIYIIRLNALPNKYLFIIIGVTLLLNGLIFFLINRKHIAFKISGIALSCILVILFSFGVYYAGKTISFFNKSFGSLFNVYELKYYVVTKKDTNLKSINKIGYYAEQPKIDEIITKLKKDYKKELVPFNELGTNVNDFMAGSFDGLLIEAGMYEFVSESFDNFNKEDYKVVKEVSIEVKEEIVSTTDKNADALNIYIGGIDFTGTNTDFNMVVTINRKTHKILLTSIPRDYYVTLPTKDNKQDILEYAGVWGISSSIAAVEDLLDIKIDYYLKLNTDSLVGLVDELGGLEYCSDVSFTTSHAQILNSYDDWKGKKLRVQKGCHEYNGIQILTIARERLAFVEGDYQRQQNCQAIIINIFKKMATTNTLTNYSDVLDAVSDLYITNIPKETIQNIIKDTVDNSNWEFVQQTLIGDSADGLVHLGTVKDYIMKPNSLSVNNAKAEINKIYSNK